MSQANELLNSLTTDTFFNGCLQVKQYRSGYRFSIDAVLVAAHAGLHPAETVLDLGTGCGIIALMLAYRNPKTKVHGIEVQPELADLAAVNVEENGMGRQITIHCMDMKGLQLNTIFGQADLVVSNPPFRKAESGRINPNRQRAVARHEIKATLFDVVETACRALRVSGRFVTIYPAERLVDVLTQMRSADIEPKFVRMIHSDNQAAAKLILAEGKKGGRPGVKIGPPLVIYKQDGSYTDEVQKMFAP